eukprot:1387502-Amorphochlora_amoeboformis.AAC.1
MKASLAKEQAAAEKLREQQLQLDEMKSRFFPHTFTTQTRSSTSVLKSRWEEAKKAEEREAKLREDYIKMQEDVARQEAEAKARNDALIKAKEEAE